RAARAADAVHPSASADVTATVRPDADLADARVCPARDPASRPADGSGFQSPQAAASPAAVDARVRDGAGVPAVPGLFLDLQRGAAASAAPGGLSTAASADAQAPARRPVPAGAPVRRDALRSVPRRPDSPAPAAHPARGRRVFSLHHARVPARRQTTRSTAP